MAQQFAWWDTTNEATRYARAQAEAMGVSEEETRYALALYFAENSRDQTAWATMQQQLRRAAVRL